MAQIGRLVCLLVLISHVYLAEPLLVLKNSRYIPFGSMNLKLPCKRSTCRFGKCENIILNNELNYTCHCVRGVTGRNCDLLDQERLPCSNSPCYSGARCFNYFNDYFCECPVGKTGKNCTDFVENAMDPCRSSPCGHDGVCFTASNGHWCFCANGNTGFDCYQPMSVKKWTRFSTVVEPLCHMDSCYNSGICLPLFNSIICACRPGFYGPKCEYRYVDILRMLNL